MSEDLNSISRYPSFLFHMKLVFELTDKKVFEKYFMFEML